MSNVSSSNGLEKYPKLRFKGFTEPWESIKFCDLFEYIPNNTLSRADLNYQQGYAKNVHYGDVLIKFGPVLDIKNDTLPYITTVDNPRLISHTLQDGDIIIADTAEDETVGKATEIVNIGSNKVVSGLHTIACRPKTTMHSTYLGFYINTPQYHKQLISLMQGIKVLSISKSYIESTVLSYPCQQEQHKICKLLNLIEARIHKQQLIIETLKKYKRGLSISIIRSLSCPTQCLSNLCDIVGGGTPDTGVPEYWNGDINWFTPTEVGKAKYVHSSNRTITKQGINKSSAKMLPANAILLTTRATLGEMSITSGPCCTNQGFQSLVAKQDVILPEYLYYLQFIIKSWCEKYSSGNTFREIRKSALSKCIVPVPTISQQNNIVRTLSLIDSLIEDHEQLLTRLSKTKLALGQYLFI